MYEYHVLRMSRTATDAEREEYMNLQGEEGWSLVTVVISPDELQELIYFKRHTKYRSF